MLQKLVKRGKLGIPVQPVIPKKILSFDSGLTLTLSNTSPPFQDIVSWKQFGK
jgi:hypothetical protein